MARSKRIIQLVPSIEIGLSSIPLLLSPAHSLPLFFTPSRRYIDFRGCVPATYFPGAVNIRLPKHSSRRINHGLIGKSGSANKAFEPSANTTRRSASRRNYIQLIGKHARIADQKSGSPVPARGNIYSWPVTHRGGRWIIIENKNQLVPSTVECKWDFDRRNSLASVALGFEVVFG